MIAWLSVWLWAALLTGPTAEGDASGNGRIERWDIFEISLAGPSSGNPFVDVHLGARFSQGDRVFTPEGFYDGDGVYRIRFMPDAQGPWTYVTESNCKELDGKRGEFTCIAAGPGNHGPVGIKDNSITLLTPMGRRTIRSARPAMWIHQTEELQQQTLTALGNAVQQDPNVHISENYTYNKNEPLVYPLKRIPVACSTGCGSVRPSWP
jgi:hypothetical protein